MQRAGQGLMLHGKPFRFVGFNDEFRLLWTGPARSSGQSPFSSWRLTRRSKIRSETSRRTRTRIFASRPTT